MPPDVGVRIGSCALTRSIVDRRLAPPFNRSVSRHDGSQDRSSSLGVLALVVALGLGARAGSRWVATAGATTRRARTKPLLASPPGVPRLGGQGHWKEPN